eukprot:jgi/Mesvir1/20013/Mv13268-RA.1
MGTENVVEQATQVVDTGAKQAAEGAKTVIKKIGFIREDGTVRPIFAVILGGTMGFNLGMTMLTYLDKWFNKVDNKNRHFLNVGISTLLGTILAISMYDMMTRLGKG